jgi:hypothetical protein
MADVSATLAGWSSTTASNSPSGATTIGTGLDDNLREIQGVVVRGLSHKGSDIASVAGTTDIGAVEGLMHDITGALAITGLGTVRAGILKVLKFEGAATLTHNATSLILPGAANITCADGDVGIFISEGSGNWRCLAYQKASAFPVKGGQKTLATAQSTASGTSWNFASIPSGVRRITIMLVGVSFDATAALRVQLGDSGGVENTGYLGGTSTVIPTESGANGTAGIDLPSLGAASVYHGTIVLDLQDAADFRWVATINVAKSDSADVIVGGYTKALSAELTQLTVGTVAGTANGDAGEINISYEF